MEQKKTFLNPISLKEKELFIHINNLQKAASLEKIFIEKIYQAKMYTSSMVINLTEFMQDQIFYDNHYSPRYKNYKLDIHKLKSFYNKLIPMVEEISEYDSNIGTKAKECLIDIYRSSRYGKKNYTKSFNVSSKLGKLKDDKYKYYLGHHYYTGNGVKKNISKAKFYFKKSSLAIGELSKYSTADLITILLEENNNKEILKYLKIGSKKGLIKAKRELGIGYFLGLYGLKKSEKTAESLLKTAASENYLNSRYILGQLYYNSNRKSNYNLAFKQFNIAAKEEEDADAMYILGEYYYFGVGSVKKNNKNAFYWFNKSAKYKNVNALIYAGWFYYNGITIKKDTKKAIRMYEVASEENDYVAIMNLGIHYFNSKQKSQNDKAYNYFYNASKIKDKDYNKDWPPINFKYDSFYYLAKCYNKGIGVKIDNNKALLELKKSTDSYSCFILGEIYYLGSSNHLEGVLVEPNLKEGSKYLAKASKLIRM